MMKESGQQKSWWKNCSGTSSKSSRRRGIGGMIVVCVFGFGGSLICRLAASRFAEDSKEPIQVLTKQLPTFGKPLHIVTAEWVTANQLSATLFVISLSLLVFCLNQAAAESTILARIEKLESELETQRKANQGSPS